MADAAADAPPVRLVVGLGNPGAKYARTRHNAGQRVVQELALCLDAGRFATRYAGHYAEAHGPSGPVALLIPATYMNDSGSSVGPAAGTLHAAAGQVLVVHDDIDVPVGEVRVSAVVDTAATMGCDRSSRRSAVPTSCVFAWVWVAPPPHSAATKRHGCLPHSTSPWQMCRRSSRPASP